MHDAERIPSMPVQSGLCSSSQILIWNRNWNSQLLHWSFDQVCLLWGCKWNLKMWCDNLHLIFAQVELHFNKYFNYGKSNTVKVHISEKRYQLSPLLPLLAGEAKPDDSFQCFNLVLAYWGIENGSASMFCAYVMFLVLFSEHYIHKDWYLKPGGNPSKFTHFAIDYFNFLSPLNMPCRNYQQEQCGDSQHCNSASGWQEISSGCRYNCCSSFALLFF